eukprot:2232036-Pyramimonas_sp.AAC.1
MNVSSYWSSLGHNLEAHVRDALLILHNPRNDREQRKVKDQILRMTVGGNLPDEYLKPKVRKLMIDAAEALCGSWVSGQIAFHCKTDQCACGDECRDAAVKHVIDLLHRLLHKRKLLVPSVNRWWKCPPTARGVLLGIAMHAVWASCCPSSWAKHPDNQDDAWQMLQGFRRHCGELDRTAPSLAPDTPPPSLGHAERLQHTKEVCPPRARDLREFPIQSRDLVGIRGRDLFTSSAVPSRGCAAPAA